MKYLFIISAVFAALFFLLLISKKNKKSEHILLSIIFLLITINSYYIFQFYNNVGFYYLPYYSELNYAIPLLYGPLLWFYTKALTQSNFSYKKYDIFHFSPFVIFLCIIFSPLIFSNTLIETRHIGYPVIKLLITPFYLFAALLLLKDYRIKLKEAYSYQIEVNLMWLSWLIAGAVVLWLIASSGYVFHIFNTQNKTLLFDSYVVGFLGIYLFALTYIAVTRTDIFTKNRATLSPIKIDNALINKPLAEDISSTESYSTELQRLKNKVEEDQLYLDPLLSINKLSEITRMPQYKISKILNKQLNQSFYDFINGYRIDAVKNKMDSGDANSLSILGIALDCGFNSKASFNRVFKKKEGITPSQYLKGIS